MVKKVLRERKPAAILGLGGFAAGVAVKLAGKRRMPVAIVNPDVIPGTANHYLMRFASAVCCQFEETRQHTPRSYQSKLRTTGCPIRPEITALPDRASAAASLGLAPNMLTLVITGASQGRRR